MNTFEQIAKFLSGFNLLYWVGTLALIVISVGLVLLKRYKKRKRNKRIVQQEEEAQNKSIQQLIKEEKEPKTNFADTSLKLEKPDITGNPNPEPKEKPITTITANSMVEQDNKLSTDGKDKKKSEEPTKEPSDSKTNALDGSSIEKIPAAKPVPESKPIEIPKEIITPKSRTKPKEKLPDAIKDDNKEITGNLFVNYQLNLPDCTDSYAVIRTPKDGCIIRSHRLGSTKRRGFKEESFQTSIQKHFGNHFVISGNVRLNTGIDTRPFEPDIAIINKKGDKNIRIDIEIDEPYAGITRQPTHCKGEDEMRDAYFTDRGWIVIRFSEFQVHTQETECLKLIARIINAIDSNISVPVGLETKLILNSEMLWDIVQAQKWEKARYREQYLHHEFVPIPEEKETIERDFSEQERNEERLVTPSIIGIADSRTDIGFNQVNAHPRDKRIVFYPEPHVYTIDNVPAPSASTIISKFFPEFDSYGAANALNPGNPLFGLPVENIVETWKQRGTEAANKGTYLHEQIEKYYLNLPFDETQEFPLFRQFVAEHPDIKPHRTEWRIFDEKYNIAGTIDLIAKNGHGYEIYDWKRSKNVVDSFTGNPVTNDRWGSCGIGQLSNVPDTSYNKYCLQQSLYRYILETNYDLKISKMYLIVLHPDYTNYFKVETPYWKDKVEYILNTL